MIKFRSICRSANGQSLNYLLCGILIEKGHNSNVHTFADVPVGEVDCIAHIIRGSVAYIRA
jgi:hypothetical protein